MWTNDFDVFNYDICRRADHMAYWTRAILCQRRGRACEFCTPFLPDAPSEAEKVSGGPFWDNLVDVGHYFWKYGPLLQKPFLLKDPGVRFLPGRRKNRASGRPSAGRKSELCASPTEIRVLKGGRV